MNGTAFKVQLLESCVSGLQHHYRRVKISISDLSTHKGKAKWRTHIYNTIALV